MFVCCVLLDMDACVLAHGRCEADTDSNSSDVVRWLQSQAAGFGPRCLAPRAFAARSLCARELSALESSSIEGYVLYGRQKGRRRVAVDVLKSLCPRCSADWITDVLRKLLQQAAPRYVKA